MRFHEQDSHILDKCLRAVYGTKCECQTYTADEHISDLALLHVRRVDSDLQLLQKADLEQVQALEVGENGLHLFFVKQFTVESTFSQEALQCGLSGRHS